MKRTLVRYKNSALRRFIRHHQKYAPILFFIGGVVFDTLTLGRIDRMYDLIMLCLHMTNLSITLYLYNLAADGKWNNTFLECYVEYLPLAIQFFFGALSSAYVIYFSRSVSLSKTVSFFIILIALLVANEFLKKRISNKYLQFGVYFFLSFTFFTFMIPVFIKEMSTTIFLISGLVSLGCTLALIISIYGTSPSTKADIHIGKLLGLVIGIYTIINIFYFLKLIPPVPLALDSGIVAHSILVNNEHYIVSYERDDSYVFWRDHSIKFSHRPGENVYVFSSIFAPTALEKSIVHRWKWYNVTSEEWEIVEDIGYDITGGRDDGFRGYTYKNNVKRGNWKVEVMTDDELVLGVVDFTIVPNPSQKPIKLVQRKF